MILAISSATQRLTQKGNGLQKWNEKCTCVFQKLIETLCFDTIMPPDYCRKRSRCRMDDPALVVGGILAQLDGDIPDLSVSYFSKRINQTVENHATHDSDMLGLV